METNKKNECDWIDLIKTKNSCHFYLNLEESSKNKNIEFVIKLEYEGLNNNQ